MGGEELDGHREDAEPEGDPDSSGVEAEAPDRDDLEDGAAKGYASTILTAMLQWHCGEDVGPVNVQPPHWPSLCTTATGSRWNRGGFWLTHREPINGPPDASAHL